jgi:hypothetical protein
MRKIQRSRVSDPPVLPKKIQCHYLAHTVIRRKCRKIRLCTRVKLRWPVIITNDKLWKEIN